MPGKQRRPAPAAAPSAPTTSRNTAGAAAFAGAGNAALASRLPRDGASTRGRRVDAPFGTFTVVPDGAALAAGRGRVIAESDFAELQALWNALVAGAGNLHIVEQDSAGRAHAGFRAKVLGYLARLLSGPRGRELVAGFVHGSRSLTIRPAAGVLYGGGAAETGDDGLVNADGTAGAGADAAIEVDPDLTDDTVVVYDAAGRPLADPAFIVLGHEMIHASHYQRGMGQMSVAPDDEAYGDREEEVTIDGAEMSENVLRDEHDLPHRYGHGGWDERL